MPTSGIDKKLIHQRYKQKKLLVSDRFMRSFLKFYIIVPATYLPLAYLLDFSSNNYITLIFLLILSLFLLLSNSNLYLTYTLGNVLLCLIESRAMFVGLWKNTEYLAIYSIVSCFFLWNLNLEFVYSSIHGYMIISVHAIIWCYCSVQSGYIKEMPPADVLFALIIAIVVQYFWYHCKISKDYEEINREIQLENKQANIQNLINAIPEAIIVMDKNFQILMSNDANQKLLHECQHTDLKIHQRFNNKQENISESLMKYVEEFRDSEERTTNFGVCDANKHYLECTGSKTDWDNSLAIVLTFRDVSNIINLEKKVSLNSKTLKILQGVSHELKTPLNQIINEHQEILYLKDGISDSIKAHIVKSLSGSKYLLSLILDMIDYSHIKFNNLGLNFSWIIVDEAIKECVSMLKDMNSSYRIYFKADTIRNASVYTDKARFKQCLLNLATLSLG